MRRIPVQVKVKVKVMALALAALATVGLLVPGCTTAPAEPDAAPPDTAAPAPVLPEEPPPPVADPSVEGSEAAHGVGGNVRSSPFHPPLPSQINKVDYRNW